MAKRNTNGGNDFNVYEFDIELSLRRRTGPYDSDVLGTVDIKRQIPCENDLAAQRQMKNLVTEEMDRILGVVDLRIDFEQNVRALTSGDTIDAEATDY